MAHSPWPWACPIAPPRSTASTRCSISQGRNRSRRAKPAQKSSKKKKKAPKKSDKQSERLFIDGYRAAHVLIYRRHHYAAAIGKLQSLGHDDNADVANLIGYASRKLGRYDDAKVWYERSLAADPNHAATWSYYGMWQAEQGNLLKAKDDR